MKRIELIKVKQPESLQPFLDLCVFLLGCVVCEGKMGDNFLSHC